VEQEAGEMEVDPKTPPRAKIPSLGSVILVARGCPPSKVLLPVIHQWIDQIDVRIDLV